MSTLIPHFARAAVSLGILYAGGMVLTFLVGILLARELGPSAYGVYALAMAATALAGMLTEFGLPLLAMREFASADVRQSWGEVRGLIRWADRIILLISALVLTGFFFATVTWNFVEESAFFATMIWAILLIPVVAIAKLRGLALLSLGHTFSGQLAVLILRPGLFALALTVVWVTEHDLNPAEAMAWQVTAAFAAMVTVCTLFLYFRPAEFRAATPENHWRKWLGATIPMGMTEGLRLLQAQTTVFLLGILLTTEAVGLFRVAAAAAAIGLVPVTLLNVIAAPYFSRLFAEKNIVELQLILSFVTFATFLPVAAIAIVLSIFSQPLLVFAFGVEYGGSAWPFIVLSLGNAAICVFGPVVTLCNMAGLERYVTVSSAGALAVQILATVILIPQWGVIGGAISVIIGLLVWNVSLTVVIKRNIGVDPLLTAFQVKMLFDLYSRFRSSRRSNSTGGGGGRC